MAIRFQKKSKTETISPEVAGVEHMMDQDPLSAIYISDDDDEVTLAQNSDKTLTSSENKLKMEDNDERIENKPSVGLIKNRLLPGKRGRVIERRKASTKRWVERKKALLAATGEIISDTDSIGSDETQMSPVQKARAKTNADKESERPKRIVKVLKNLETNFTEKYSAARGCDHIIVGETDSDTRKMRLSKELQSNNAREEKNSTNKQDNVRRTRSSSQEHSMEKENTPVSSTMSSEDRAKKPESRADDKIFTPRMIKSELAVGNDKYIVTSTLIRTGTSRLSKDALNNLSKDSKSANVDDSNREKNTDIIEAVQLRRVNPVPVNLNRKKYERCLNVDVETTELESLKRVQIELANFIQVEMKQKLLGVNDGAAKVNWTENSYGKAYRKLDQQLKGIVKKTIISNIESSFVRDTSAPIKEYDESPMTTSWESIETMKNSPVYQPIVIVERLDIEKERKLRKINNVYVLKQAAPKNKLIGPFSVMARKRQSVPPKRYNDYNTSALDSDSDEMEELIYEDTPKVMNTPNLKTYGSVAKQSSGANNQLSVIKRADASAVKAVDNDVTASQKIEENSTAAVNEEKPDYEETKIEESISENHICGVCGLSFPSRKDVETHVRTHKTTNVEDSTITVTRQVQKQKVKRCKRCQTLVDARYVKAHVCKTSLSSPHKCYVCYCSFRTEKLLIRHLENHDQSEFKIENIKKMNTLPKLDKKQTPKNEVLTKSSIIVTEKSEDQSDKNAKHIDEVEKSKETYTCFVCDKIFTDEEVLKDHLQKHCDDLSESEQSNSKEQYQCAICGNTLESDQALEEHVGKHLFDDEDDNPNLISIREQDSDQSRIYQCDQCSMMFDSEVLLEIHVQAHEEEDAIAEWQKKETEVYSYECMLCDECIGTEEQLAEHLDTMHNIHNTDAQICRLCEQSFNTLKELQEHVATQKCMILL